MSSHFKKRKSYKNELNALDEYISAEKGYLYSVEEYDDSGNLLVKTVYGDKGKLYDTVKCSYDGRGRLTEEEIMHHFENQKQRRELKYDEELRTITERTFYDGGGDASVVSRYNEKGQLLRLERYYGENDLEEVEEFSYDPSGRLLSHLILTPEGDTISEDDYSYENEKVTISKSGDENIKEIHHMNGENAAYVQVFKDDTLLSEIIREYDEHGLGVKERIKEGNLLIIEKTFGYDENKNRVLEEIMDHRYKRSQKTMLEYDSSGLILSEMHFTTFRAGENYRITYEYE